MMEDPEGLAFTLERIDTLIQKLDLLQQACHDQLTRLGRKNPTIRTRINSGVYQQTAPTSIPTAATSSASQMPSVHLPKLELPLFSGKPFAWFEFWDIFEATVDRHPHLSPVEKLKYLISCLRGEAKDSVSGCQLIDANYQPVINTLRTLYGDKDEVSRRLVGTTQFSTSDLWNLDLVGINLAEECQVNDARAQQMFNHSLNRRRLAMENSRTRFGIELRSLPRPLAVTSS